MAMKGCEAARPAYYETTTVLRRLLSANNKTIPCKRLPCNKPLPLLRSIKHMQAVPGSTFCHDGSVMPSSSRVRGNQLASNCTRWTS